MLLQIRPAFFTRVLFGSSFPKSCLKVGGAAYTQVFTVFNEPSGFLVLYKLSKTLCSLASKKMQKT